MIVVKNSTDQKQRDQALNINDSFIIQAPAGSGKTELLTQRYLNLLGEVGEPESILAMTFTNKAADELRHRVLQYLSDANLTPPKEIHKLKTFELANKALAQSSQQGWDLLNNPSRIKISTIDALSSLIVSKYPTVEQLIPPRVMADRYEYEALYRSAAENTFKLLEDDEFQESIASVLLHLDNHVEKFYRLLTHMLAKREQWLPRLYQQGALEIEVLEKTAQKIISEHLLKVKIVASSFFDEAFFAAIQENDWVVSALPDSNIESLAAWIGLANLCLTSKGQWRKTVDKRQGFDPALKEQKQAFIAMLEKLSPEDGLQEALFDLTLLPESHHNEADYQVLQDISQVLKLAVAQLKLLFTANNVFDFSEVGLNASEKLDDLAGVTDVALFLDYKIEHLLIDEFQDTSYSQFSLIEKLLLNWQDDSGKTLFLVGDPMQSIYRFRESQVGIFLQVKESGIADIRPKYLQLNTNFRSNKSIVDSNNRYFSAIFPSNDNVINGAIHYAHSQSISELVDDNAVRFYSFLSGMAQQEAVQVCEIVKDALAENSADEIAILVRSRSHLDDIINTFQLNGIDYEAIKTTTLRSHLYTRDLLSLTRAMISLGDKLAWLALLRAPWCGLLLEDLLTLSASDTMTIYHQLNDKEANEALSNDAVHRILSIQRILGEAIENDGRFSFVERFSCALDKLLPHECLDEEKRSIKTQFLSTLHHCESRDALAIVQVEAMLGELYAPSHSARVKLMTIHQAKGLEFDVVILPGLGRAGKSDTSPLVQLKALADRNLLLAPIKSAFDKDESKTYAYLKHLDKKQNHFEMMRLLYVAMSRAKKKIHLLGHVNEGGEAVKNTLLNFILPFFKNSMDVPAASTEAASQDAASPQLVRYESPPSIEEFDVKIADESFNLSKNLDLAYQSALGTIVHHYLEFEIFTPNEKSIETKLLQLGVPSKLRGPQSDTILRLLDNTKKDSTFDWLFQQRDSTQVEAEFGHADCSIIIDRLFVEKGILWIVDFKTASPAPGESIDVFIGRIKQQHQEQLLHYQSILEGIFQLPAKAAIYCPAIPKLICL
ncbi:MAG: UvrD-helicase domain-containing protein [Gammaproteobacteria bacterium]